MTNRSEPVSEEWNDLVDSLAKRLAETEYGAGHGGSSPRDLACECLKAITASGFEVPASSLDSQSDLEPASNFEDVENLANLQLRGLLDLGHRFSGPALTGPAKLYAEIANRVLKSGEPLLAYDILQVHYDIGRGICVCVN